MSYILDALKKSEQERGNGAIPGVQTIHSSSINYHQEKRSIWPWLLAILISINLIAVIYFIQHTNTDENIAKTLAGNTNEIVSPVNPREDSTSSLDSPTTVSQSSPTPKVISEPEPQSVQQTTYPVPELQTVDLYDLPLSIRQHIPEMKFSAHVYSSNPLQRSLVINNRFMEEGSQVNDDLLLNEITSDGAVFEFQGHRFSTSVISGWD